MQAFVPAMKRNGAVLTVEGYGMATGDVVRVTSATGTKVYVVNSDGNLTDITDMGNRKARRASAAKRRGK